MLRSSGKLLESWQCSFQKSFAFNCVDLISGGGAGKVAAKVEIIKNFGTVFFIIKDFQHRRHDTDFYLECARSYVSVCVYACVCV